MTAGRPTKRLDPVIGSAPTLGMPDLTVEEFVLEKISRGVSREMTCLAAGIAPNTLSNWENADEEFLRRLQAAESWGYIHHADNLHRCSTDPEATATNLKATNHFLATRSKDAWIEKKAIEHSGQVDLSSAVAAIEDIGDAMEDDTP